MIVKIDPIDTLFFRDGKPFTMGSDTWADAIFPPHPSVIYGALRSAYFSNHIDELEKANETSDPTKTLKIKGIYFLIGNDIYYPLPIDCVREKNNVNDIMKVTMLSVIENKGISSCAVGWILSCKGNEKVENVPDGLIRKSMFKKYLLLENPSRFSIRKLNDFIISEPKIGIGIDRDTHASEESKLYRVDMQRLEDRQGTKLSIIVDFEGLTLPEEGGLIKLGGEGKAVSYNKYDESVSVGSSVFIEKRFKVYLATPAIFENGWLPKWIDEKTLIGNYKGIELRLLTASIGKQINIGGFDMKRKRPKPMYKAVPAGSIYCFEIIKGDTQKFHESFNGTAISDVYPEQGFGISFLGKLQ